MYLFRFKNISFFVLMATFVISFTCYVVSNNVELVGKQATEIGDEKNAEQKENLKEINDKFLKTDTLILLYTPNFPQASAFVHPDTELPTFYTILNTPPPDFA